MQQVENPLGRVAKVFAKFLGGKIGSGVPLFWVLLLIYLRVF
jgi:hypothetical protein